VARRRPDPAALAGPVEIRPEFRHHPTTADEVARWVPVDEQAPPGWCHELYAWRVIAAHARWSEAMRAWCAEHGLRAYDVFHPRARSGQ